MSHTNKPRSIYSYFPITSQKHKQPSPKHKHPYVFRLPNEILHEIFALTKFHDLFRTRTWLPWCTLPKENRTLLALSLCCRRFHFVVAPILYGDIFVGPDSEGVPVGIGLDKLWPTLRASPMLGQMCKELVTRHVQGNAVSMDLVESIKKLPNVQKLEIHGLNGDWPALPVLIKHMPWINKLSLIGHGYWPLTDLVIFLDFPNLRTLHLSPVYGVQEVWPDYTPLKEPVIPAHKRRTSLLKSIQICDLRCHTDDVKDLLTWPREIEELSLCYYHWDPPLLLHIRAAHEVFCSQKDTLRRIKLTTLTTFESDPFEMDFSYFPNLESIEVPWLSLPPSAAEAATKLCGPSVTSLKFNFLSEVVETTAAFAEIFSAFNQEAYDYLLQLGTCAHRQGSSLRVVSIERGGVKFNDLLWPTRMQSTRKHVAECYASWRLMERLRNEMALFGIEFDYIRPRLTEATALECILAIKKGWGKEQEEKNRRFYSRSLRRSRSLSIISLEDSLSSISLSSNLAPGQSKITEFFETEIN